LTPVKRLVCYRCVAYLARLFAICVAVLAVAGLGVLLYCEHENSAQAAFPTEGELRSSLTRAAGWIVRNRVDVLNENNSMLWLFVRESAWLTDDAPLESLANEFQDRSTRGTIAQFLFDPTAAGPVRQASIILSNDWEGYQRLFVYGATCNLALRSDPEVLAMLSPSACMGGIGFRNPWCRTHQLMGLRFVQKNRCEPAADTARTIRGVQDGILAELKWDFRVEDAYLQKVWTLVESGRRSEIKAIWVRRILDAQRGDGGWSGAGMLVGLPGDRALSWQGGLRPRVGEMPASDFHATAQGLYLMALLLNGITADQGRQRKRLENP
jgi:hypothetical protein